MKAFGQITRAIALVVVSAMAIPAFAAERVTYIHFDALGSPVAGTDQNGNVVWRETYRPYGERIRKEPASSTNSRWYTGHPEDPETGFVYAGARYYDPVIGRFMAVDPVAFTEENAHSFNRYAYGNSNPYRYVDPDGNSPIDERLRNSTGLLDSGFGPGMGGAGPSFKGQWEYRQQLERAAAERLQSRTAGSADTIPAGQRISPYRLTGQGETFIRYESGNPEFTRVTPSGGVKPGTFAAPASDGIVPVANRVPVYNLPSPQIPRKEVRILEPPPGTPIIGPRPVAGGTGNEVVFPTGY